MNPNNKWQGRENSGMCRSWENSTRRKEERKIRWRKWEKWVLRATADKTRKISYQTIHSFYRTYSSSPPLLPFFVRRQNAYHQGNPLITTATHSIKCGRTKSQPFQWWQASCHITTTYLNRPSVNQQLCPHCRCTRTRTRARSDQSYRNPLWGKFAASW